jgi:hypothetical protein
MDIDTDHGYYQALPYRDGEDGPDGAVLTVFRDGGSIAGYVAGQDAGQAATWAAFDGRLTVVGERHTIEGAAAAVAEADRKGGDRSMAVCAMTDR